MIGDDVDHKIVLSNNVSIMMLRPTSICLPVSTKPHR